MISEDLIVGINGFSNNEKNISFRNSYKNMYNIEKNIIVLNNQNFHVNSQFAYYLTGLIEGDGSIIVPSLIEKGRKRYPLIKIVFSEKDLPLAEKINLELKKGKIYKGKGKYFTLVFYRLDIVFLILHLINGKMRTPKIEALNRLIEWFNVKYEVSLNKKSIDLSDLGNNAWLAGFIDTDGSFYSGVTLNKENLIKDIRCYMRLSQRQEYPIRDYELNLKNVKNNVNYEYNKIEFSYFDVMTKIKTFLSVRNVRIIKRIRSMNYLELGYEIRTSKLNSNEILINYLNKYPLYTSKYLDYLCWKDIYDLKKNKKYKLKEEIDLLMSLKSAMNSKRVSFDWNLLNTFWVI